MDLREELKSAGAYPSGPASAWPQERNIDLVKKTQAMVNKVRGVKAKPTQMAQGLVRTAGQFLTNGKVSSEIREQRYDICKTCPAFIEDSKRCSECGCFMEAKTWVGGDPKNLCPLKKWEK
jgi:hypothetical protein